MVTGLRRPELGNVHYVCWLSIGGDLSKSSFCSTIAVEDCRVLSNKWEVLKKVETVKAESIFNKRLEKRKRWTSFKENWSAENEKNK